MDMDLKKGTIKSLGNYIMDYIVCKCLLYEVGYSEINKLAYWIKKEMVFIHKVYNPKEDKPKNYIKRKKCN